MNTKIFSFFIIALLSQPLFAAEKKVVLDVKHMNCPTCPITVKLSLKDVEGVEDVKISFADKTASVTYDDAVTNNEELTEATTDAGYPSTVRVN
jgi:mercuric ion binding protein